MRVVITGAGGFIGFNVLKSFYKLFNIVAIDNNVSRMVNFTKDFNGITYLSVEDSYLWLEFNAPTIDYVIHLGARTDTTEKDERIFNRLNLNYSKFIWNFCSEENIPLIYASSAAVYGDGANGFSEDLMPFEYYPLNPYGRSKLDFDIWNEQQSKKPPYWAGLRFFNVYGPYENHKGRMASVVWHFYNQIKKTGDVKLFKSYINPIAHGEQMRDFIYVRDVVNVIFHLFMGGKDSGIYNLGTGRARTYNDLARAIFKSLGKEENILYIDMPEDIRNSYQYFTEAKMGKLRGEIGEQFRFIPLEEGIEKYINLLEHGKGQN